MARNREHFYCIAGLAKQRVAGKPGYTAAADIRCQFKRKLPGSAANALNHRVKRLKIAQAQSGPAGGIKVDQFKVLKASARVEKVFQRKRASAS